MMFVENLYRLTKVHQLVPKQDIIPYAKRELLLPPHFPTKPVLNPFETWQMESRKTKKKMSKEAEPVVCARPLQISKKKCGKETTPIHWFCPERNSHPDLEANCNEWPLAPNCAIDKGGLRGGNKYSCRTTPLPFKKLCTNYPGWDGKSVLYMENKCNLSSTNMLERVLPLGVLIDENLGEKIN